MADEPKQTCGDAPPKGGTGQPPRQVPETKESTDTPSPGPHQEHAGERS